MKPMPVKLPEELHTQAKEKSERTGVPIAHILRKALRHWVSQPDDVVFDPEEVDKPAKKKKGK